LPDKLVKKALLGEKIGNKEAIADAEPTTNLLDENVNWASVQLFFNLNSLDRDFRYDSRFRKEPTVKVWSMPQRSFNSIIN